MAKASKPPRFKPFRPPEAISAQKIAKQGRFRGSPAERGYDDKWNRLSIAFRKQNPFCRLCEEKGRDTLAALVDHIVPVSDRPERVHDWRNLQSLCKHCHGIKFTWERKAREMGDIDLLTQWVKDPLTRPSGL